MKSNDEASAILLDRLNEGKTVQLIPQGISMLPFIKGGRDKVLIRKEEKIAVGDIVLKINGTAVSSNSEVWGTVMEIVKPNGCCRKPHKAWLWRHTLPFRRIVLKLRRKWYKLRNLNPE